MSSEKRWCFFGLGSVLLFDMDEWWEELDLTGDDVLKDLVPGPALASTTCFQSLWVPGGSFFHLLTSRTHALQISPDLLSEHEIRKHFSNSGSYFLESVNRDEDDLALHMQHPLIRSVNFWLMKTEHCLTLIALSFHWDLVSVFAELSGCLHSTYDAIRMTWRCCLLHPKAWRRNPVLFKEQIKFMP